MGVDRVSRCGCRQSGGRAGVGVEIRRVSRCGCRDQETWSDIGLSLPLPHRI